MQLVEGGGGGKFFVLDEAKEWRQFTEDVAQSCQDAKTSYRIRRSDNAEREEWYDMVALRVKMGRTGNKSILVWPM